ncbi:DUF3159 domain-containing protein [Streptomyces libani]|uniref:DUF3159 domain-containing protein n=1 Tax=Streptomyces TaxID=1883 RepID=UPI00225968AB|nr:MULTISPECIES: DUF3159 domain-containing protein [Streptomyces]MCX5444553.1 DUF3159 domain-containing protein [Streptomyces libani]WDT56195.1 DUF3159 domain-containing protein [Streptomyces sp. G7(2002)]
MDPTAHHMADGEEAAQAVLRSRLRAAVIDIAPIFGFTVSFAFTHQLTIALALALAAAAGVCVYRVVRGESVWRALAVLGLVCVQGTLAAKTGDASNFFLPNLVMHSVVVVANAVMLLIRRPLMGVAVALITKEGPGWHRCPVRRRAYIKGNLLILASSAVMLTIQLSLYLSGQVVALGTADAFGPPVLALSTLLGWRIYRRALGGHSCATNYRTTPETSLPLERTLP